MVFWPNVLSFFNVSVGHLYFWKVSVHLSCLFFIGSFILGDLLFWGVFCIPHTNNTGTLTCCISLELQILLTSVRGNRFLYLGAVVNFPDSFALLCIIFHFSSFSVVSNFSLTSLLIPRNFFFFHEFVVFQVFWFQILEPPYFAACLYSSMFNLFLTLFGKPTSTVRS